MTHGGYEAFAAMTGIAKGACYAISSARGNLTWRIIERIAASLDMDGLELLGFEANDARRALKRSGVDYDDLAAAPEQKNKADLRVAGKARALKVAPSGKGRQPPEPARRTKK